HVVTANKALLSNSWEEIFAAASDSGTYINFEASVGGAIPVIRAIKEGFVANKIKTIYGILNGTTNFILTKMAAEGMPFKEALAIAQEKGIAERNPELDVSGKDSAHKLSILSMLAFGRVISNDEVYTEGISGVSPIDIACAAKWGYSIKLLAIAKNSPSGLQLRVHPTLVPSSHILANVRGEDNAISMRGDLVGESLLYGKGAGARPTASSVVSDVIDIARRVAFYGKKNPAPYNVVHDRSRKGIVPMEDITISYYLRFSVTDRPGVLARIASMLADNGISIASVSQEERKEGQTVPVIILTHKAREGDLRKAIAKIDDFDLVKGRTVVIRREE
ncbi:MAG: homoserine dehydrogenase, partial [Candidatus Omnitrophica bacterium]|nr:homoserine dehydrogenase [Candidatus Omnitrophota bacterium]